VVFQRPLKNYDYSSPGEYFITLCIKNRECRLGEINNREMILNSAGDITDLWWNKIPEKFFNARLDIYQIMPNHFHGIIGIFDPDNTAGVDPNKNPVGVDPRVNPKENVVNPKKDGNRNQGGISQGRHAGTSQPNFEKRPAAIPDIVQWFKTMTTNEYIQEVKVGRFPPFDGKLWQRNYYDHIIRNKKSLERIQNYIINNPAQWK
jgi:REP element-mobilizing transposase RayT